MKWYIQAFKNYINFEGRASRSEYWFFFLFNVIAAVICIGLTFAASWMINLYYLFVLAVIIPTLSVSIRRLHDIGKTGWWYLIVVVPLLGALVVLYFFVQPSQPGSNQYGSSPSK